MWCLEGALLSLSHAWQEGRTVEFVNFIVGSAEEPDCPTAKFRHKFDALLSR